MDPLLFNPQNPIDSVSQGRATQMERYLESRQKENDAKATAPEGEFLKKYSEGFERSRQTAESHRHGYHISSGQLDAGMSRRDVLEHTRDNPERKKLYEAAMEFESFFVEKMFKEMKKNINKGEMFHGGFAEEVFDDMLMTERVRSLSANTEMGLAEKMYQQLQNI